MMSNTFTGEYLANLAPGELDYLSSIAWEALELEAAGEWDSDRLKYIFSILHPMLKAMVRDGYSAPEQKHYDTGVMSTPWKFARS